MKKNYQRFWNHLEIFGLDGHNLGTIWAQFFSSKSSPITLPFTKILPTQGLKPSTSENMPLVCIRLIRLNPTAVRPSLISSKV